MGLVGKFSDGWLIFTGQKCQVNIRICSMDPSFFVLPVITSCSRDKDGCTPSHVPMVFIVFSKGFLGIITHTVYPLYRAYMDVSENSGTPKSSHFNGVFHDKPSILGYPYFLKTPI